jgi:methionine synthase I (cobalamin-dependent)
MKREHFEDAIRDTLKKQRGETMTKTKSKEKSNKLPPRQAALYYAGLNCTVGKKILKGQLDDLLDGEDALANAMYVLFNVAEGIIAAMKAEAQP